MRTATDVAPAQFEVPELQALAERTGLPLVRWHLLCRQASLAALAGNFDTCRRLGGQAAGRGRILAGLLRPVHPPRTDRLPALLRGDPADIDPQWTSTSTRSTDSPRLPGPMAAALLLVGGSDEAYATTGRWSRALRWPPDPAGAAAVRICPTRAGIWR